MTYKSALDDLRENLFSTPVFEKPISTSGLINPKQFVQPLKDVPSKRNVDWLRQIQETAQRVASQPSKKDAFAEGFSEGLDTVPEKRGPVSKETSSKAAPSLIERKRGHLPSLYAPMESVDAKMPDVLNALASIESKGSGNYKAVGPIVEKGSYKGQRAYGRYQVMEGNIPSWTKMALGKTLTTEEFVADEAAQDAVAAYQLQKSKDKHGTWEDAASVWFSGRPIKSAGNASDGYTTVPDYIRKFQRYFKG